MKVKEQTLFQIICSAGEARSFFVEAMRNIIKEEYITANEKLKDGKRLLADSHGVHFNLIQEVAKGNEVEVGLLLVHAEDIMMSAETLGIIAETLLGRELLEGERGNEET